MCMIMTAVILVCRQSVPAYLSSVHCNSRAQFQFTLFLSFVVPLIPFSSLSLTAMLANVSDTFCDHTECETHLFMCSCSLQSWPDQTTTCNTHTFSMVLHPATSVHYTCSVNLKAPWTCPLFASISAHSAGLGYHQSQSKITGHGGWAKEKSCHARYVSALTYGCDVWSKQYYITDSFGLSFETPD